MKLFRFISWSRRSPVDVAALLPKVAGKALARKVLSTVSDRRRHVSEIARAAHCTEWDVLKAISDRTGLAVAREVAAFSPNASRGRFHFGRLREAGAIPVFEGAHVAEFVCVDPSLLVHVLPEARVFPCKISTWFLIAQALDESERLAIAAKEEAQIRKRERDAKVAREVLDLIIDDAQSYRAPRLSIIRSNDVAWYEFSTLDGKRGRGNVDVAIWDGMLSCVAACAWGQVFTENSQGSARVVRSDQAMRIDIELSYHESNSLQRDAGTSNPDRDERRDGKVISFPMIHQSDDRAGRHAEGAIVGEDSILVIDDNASFCTVLERFFSRDGFAVIRAQRCEEALARIEAGGCFPRLLVCDVHLPGMNGFEFLKRIRALSYMRDVPVIMLTSDDDVETELKLLGDGADLFLLKTVDPRVLRLHARRLVERGRKSEQGAA